MDDIPVIPIALIILLLVVVGVVTYKEAQHWEQFKVEHNCKIVGQSQGEISTGIGTDGKVTTIVGQDKTGYLCDDGVTYWR